MLLICTAKVSVKCQKVVSRHSRSAQTKERVCPFCWGEINSNPKVREQYYSSVLKGTDNGPDQSRKRVRR